MTTLKIWILPLFVLLVAVGTASAQITSGPINNLGSCGTNCIIYQQTDYWNATPTYASTDLTAAPVDLPQWNYSMSDNMLEDVVLDVDGYIQGSITVTNDAASQEAGGATTLSTFKLYNAAAALLNGPSGTPLSFSVGEPPSAPVVLNPGQEQEFTGLSSGATALYGISLGSLATGSCAADALELSCYEGSGDVDYTGSTKTNLILDFGGGNVSAGQSTQAALSGQVTYTWDFTGVPEPTTVALIGSGLIGLGLLRRKRLHR